MVKSFHFLSLETVSRTS